MIENHTDEQGSALQIPPVDVTQHATILAALRYYQQQGMGNPSNRSSEIDAIATNDGAVAASLDEVGIDDLCELVNSARPLN